MANPNPSDLLSDRGIGRSVGGVGKTITVKQHQRVLPPKKTGGKGKGGGKTTPTPPNATGTSKVIPNPVDAQVTAAQLPANQSIDNSSAASKTAAQNAATTTEGYYAALANLLSGIGKSTQAGYDSAAGNDSAFGKGFSDGLAHVQTQDQQIAAQNAAGSGGVAPPPVDPAAGNALYALGGYIPATTMSREGAAFGAAANMLPNTAAGQGAATIQGIAAQQRLDQAGFDKQRSDLAAQAPGLRAQYQAQADASAGAAAARRQTAINAANHEADVRRQQQISMILATGVGPDGKLTPKAQAELANALGYDPMTGKATAKTTIAATNAATAQTNAATSQARLTLAQQTAFSNMYGVDANGNMTLAGKRAEIAQQKANQAGKKGGFTKAQLAKLSNQAATDADIYRHGKVVQRKGTGGVWETDPTKSIPSEPDYQVALKAEMAKGIPMSVATRALDLYWPRGNANQGKLDAQGAPLPFGRPFLTWEERQALGHVNDPFAAPTAQQVAILKSKGFNYDGPVANIYPSKNG